MMFQKTTRFYLPLFIIIVSGWIFSIVYVTKKDLLSAQKILDKQKQLSSQTVWDTTYQKRQSVVKEIWFTQEDLSRLHYRICSQSSLLTLKPEGKKFEVVEKLENIQCWMQDKLYAATDSIGPMQQVRFLQAQEGLYRFTTQEFLAQSVFLSLYRLIGSELPYEMTPHLPFLKGRAEDVSFAVSGKNPQFMAQHFKAEFSPIEEKK